MVVLALFFTVVLPISLIVLAIYLLIKLEQWIYSRHRDE
jgi:hypothetical protein